MASSVSILLIISLTVAGCVAQLPTNVSIRLTDARYGNLCYIPGGNPNLVLQGTNKCAVPTCFTTVSGSYYLLRGKLLLMCTITQTNQQIILRNYSVRPLWPVKFAYNTTARQLETVSQFGQKECLIPYGDKGLNVPGLSSCIPSIEVELLHC